jgi:hypothetical protein
VRFLIFLEYVCLNRFIGSEEEVLQTVIQAEHSIAENLTNLSETKPKAFLDTSSTKS